MQQKWIVPILIALIIALVSFNVGKISANNTTGFFISSNSVTIDVSPEKVSRGEKVFFTVDPNGNKYYTAIDIYKKNKQGLSTFVANVDVNTEHGSCRLCKDVGTAGFLTAGLSVGDYNAEVLPVGAKKPISVDFSIV